MPIQEGIYWDSGQRPGSAWGILFLRVGLGVQATQVDAILTGLSQIYDGLRRGETPGLPGATVPAMDLTILIGFGPKAFAISGAKRPLPVGLGPQYQFLSPKAAGGGVVLPGSGLTYDEGIARNGATEEVMVQAIANSPLAVARVFVETHAYLSSQRDELTAAQLIEVAAGYTGFNREDGRSWIDFHDGVSNLRSGSERYGVAAIKRAGAPIQDRWTVDGSYLAFIRASVDLERWRNLSLNQQELAVGRTKLTGCPIDRLDGAGSALPIATCPLNSAGSVIDPGNEAFREPPSVADPAVLASHVQRANHHIGPTNRDVSQRIFRQGYEFIDPPAPGQALRQGLNFVSFQDNIRRLFFMLTQPGWLGNTNFGGSNDALNMPLLRVLAAGAYLCPPKNSGETYPGQSIFT